MEASSGKTPKLVPYPAATAEQVDGESRSQRLTSVGRTLRRERRWWPRAGALILCYHAISSSWEHELAVSLPTFRAQLTRLLRAGFAPATADEAIHGSGRLLHVTFDDAFTSVLLALPVLQELGVAATVFASSAYADVGAPLAVPGLRTEAERNPDELATLDWDGLRQLSKHGVEIGSHSETHPHLPALDDHELRRELVESKRRIDDEVGVPCRFLAYPFGDHNARAQRAAEAAGYEAAFALPGGASWMMSPNDRFQVPRVGIWRREGALKFGIKTSRFVRTPVGSWMVRVTSRGASRSVSVEQFAEQTRHPPGGVANDGSEEGSASKDRRGGRLLR